MPLKRIGFLFILSLSLITVRSQGEAAQNSVEIHRNIQKLNFLGTALYVAAHPDDENQRIISYLANHHHARTAYLSVTRGGGGQNLIGPELQELLGVLRTQELLAARRIDGGEQFFTRAKDFGYSKHPDETFGFWNKEEVLSDVVHLLREFRPDVIINRFDHRSPGTTHGHHTGSALLSLEAFKKAADPEYDIPSGLDPWQVQRVFFNTSWWFYGSQEAFEQADKSNLLSIDTGTFYPDLGLSNNEIAAMARSMHRCQGFGQALQRGSQEEYLEYIAGSDSKAPGSIFEGVDTSWERVEGGKPIGKILEKVEAEFNFKDPSVHLTELLEAYTLLLDLPDGHWKDLKLPLLKEIILDCAGLYVQVFSAAEVAMPGSELRLSTEVTLRSQSRLEFIDLVIPRLGSVREVKENVAFNRPLRMDWVTPLPADLPINSHYWLRQQGSTGTYAIAGQDELNQPQNPPDLEALLRFRLNEYELEIRRPILHKRIRPEEGESLRAFRIVPPLSADLEQEVLLFPDKNPQAREVVIRAFEDSPGPVELTLKAGDLWNISPRSLRLPPLKKGQLLRERVQLTPPEHPDRSELTITAVTGGRSYSFKSSEISYDHIPDQLVLRPQSTLLIREDIQIGEGVVGYIEGAGDSVDEGLIALGIPVQTIRLDTLQSATQLSGFKAIVMGIRAYNVASELLQIKQPMLLEYVRKGGNLIVQYNTALRWGNQFEGIAPYPMQISRSRVTDEKAAVRILDGTHPALNYPNTVSLSDFDLWVQERGLYFPERWDANFRTLIRTGDPGEPALDGGILHAPYGRGNYFYSSLSFFRQFPSGVPGAYKLFVNLLYARPNEQ